MKKTADKHEELLRVLDKNGVWMGIMETRFTIHQRGYYYNSVSLLLIDRTHKQVLLEQRSFNKANNPGKWALIGGHVVEHEDPLNAIITEAYEEVGIDISKMKIRYLCTLKPVFGSKSFNHIFYIFMSKKIKDFRIQKEEVEQVKYFSIDEWKKNIIARNPKFAGRYQRYKEVFDKINERLANEK